MVLADRSGWFARCCSLLVVGCVLALVGGCSSNEADKSANEKPADEQQEGSEKPAQGETSEQDTEEEAGDDIPDSDEPFELGNALEPFDPPSLEEIDKTADWQDRPVYDAEEALREELAEEGGPKVSVAEALKLKNNFPESSEANEKILSALGQLAPGDGSGVDYDQNFVRQVIGDIGTTNPLFVQTVSEFEYAGFTGLSFPGFNRRFEWYLPTSHFVSWQTSKDGMMDKIVMRDDLTWSDGKPLTAHDVAFSFKVIMSDHPELIIPAVRQGTEELKAVVAYDDQTLVYFHKESLATNTGNMNFPVLPKHVYEKSLIDDPSMKKSKYHRDLEKDPVVAGAYTLKSRKRGQEFVVERRESYYMHNGKQVRKKPYLKQVRVKIITDVNTALLAQKAGDIHSMELRPEQWESQTSGSDFYERNTKVTALDWSAFNFCWNMESRYFSDRRVRWAMSYAVDYDELLNTICRGLYQQGQGTYHPTSPMFPEEGIEMIAQDLDKAEDLLDEAGWGDSDGDGIRDKKFGSKVVPFEFTLMTYQSDTGIQAATLMKECLDQIGIIAHVKPTEFAVMTDKLMKREYDASMNGWGTGADPDTSANIWKTGENRNYPGYSNPQVDQLFEDAKRELDRDKRMALYGEIQKLLWDDQPYTWLFYRNSFYAFNKKLRGYNFSPRGPYDYSPGIDSIYVPAKPL